MIYCLCFVLPQPQIQKELKLMFNEGCKEHYLAPNIQKTLTHTLTAQHEEESVEWELMEVI